LTGGPWSSRRGGSACRSKPWRRLEGGKKGVDVIDWGLDWGCPFILYWQLYCNEVDDRTGRHRGFWLIDDQGDKQPTWHLHRDFLRQANAWVDDYRSRHGRLPRQAEYNAAARNWIRQMGK